MSSVTLDWVDLQSIGWDFLVCSGMLLCAVFYVGCFALRHVVLCVVFSYPVSRDINDTYDST